MTIRRPFDRPTPARAELDALITSTLGFRLGPYLRRLAQASVAAAVVAGCNTSHTSVDAGSIPDAGEIDAAGFDAGPPPPPPPPGLCSTDGRWQALDGLTLTRDPSWIGQIESVPGGIPQITVERGERCADATDTPACVAAITELEQTTYQRALLTQTGDAVDALEEEAELLGLLGPIDTAHEAALVAWRAGYDIWCSETDPTSVTQIPGGWRVVGYRQSGGCGTPWVTTRHTVRVESSGAVTEESSEVIREEEDFGCVGRRPAGLRADAPGRASDPVGAFFAQIAVLEASAVDAFDVMIDELTGLGAPPALIDAARAAREDEVRHTASMGAIARRYGAEPGTSTFDPIEGRSALDIALENAVEGCVRETFGALLGAYQADAARDPEIRAAMREVADDELRHAELSWALAGWLEPRLSEADRARVEEARREAIVALRDEAARTHDPALVEVAGLPTADAAVAMVDRLAHDLWS